MKHLFWSQGVDSRGEVLTHGDLILNLETYQATVNGRPLDLTYMEYELLKFLVSHPGKVLVERHCYHVYGGMTILAGLEQ